MYERFTDRAREVMKRANREAQVFNVDDIDTEHLLLGLLRNQDGVTTQLLLKHGLTVESVREEILKVLHGR